MKLVAGLAIKNEEWIIGKVLESLSIYCDTIVITDDNSSDNTEIICKRYPKVKFYKRPEHLWYKREEGKQRIELWNYVVQENPDYILLLDGDEVPTPSIKNFLDNIDNEVNCWRIRMINLYKDEEHYRTDKFITSTGININNDPFDKNAWKKTVLLKYDKNYKYIYDEKCEKGPVSKFHPLPDNTPEVIKDTDEFYIIHYGKISDKFLSGDKNKEYAKMEEYEKKGSYIERLNHHEICRLEGPKEYKKCPKEWYWNIEDRKEIILKGKDVFENSSGSISNYLLNENINWLGLIYTVKHAMRSNHYHPEQEQKVLVIKGKYLSVSKDLLKYNSKINVTVVSEGDLIITPPNVAHTNIFLEDTISINLVNGDRYKEDFDKHTIKYELVNDNEKNEYIMNSNIYLN